MICIHAFTVTAAQTWNDTTTTDQSETASEAPSTPVPNPVQHRTPGGGKKHHFVPKTVRLETRSATPVLSRIALAELNTSVRSLPVFLHQGDQVWLLCGLWEENKVWKDVSSLPGLSGGGPPRVPWPLPCALQSRGYPHSHEDGRGDRLRFPFSTHPQTYAFNSMEF